MDCCEAVGIGGSGALMVVFGVVSCAVGEVVMRGGVDVTDLVGDY